MMRVRTQQILAVSTLAMSVAAASPAQSPAGSASNAAGPIARLTAAHRGEIVKAAAATLAEHYVDEQVGRTIGDLLKKQLQTGAVIIDVRRNPCGSGNMGDLLASHFLGSTPVATLKVKSRRTPEPMTVNRQAAVPGPRRPPLHPDESGHGIGGRSVRLRAEEPAPRHHRWHAKRWGGHMVAFAPAGYGFTLGFSS